MVKHVPQYLPFFGLLALIGLLFANGWMLLLARAPATVTYLALFLPVVLFFPFSILLLIYYYFVWKYVPFTIELIKVAAEVFGRHRSLLGYGLLLMLLQLLWGVFSVAGLLGALETSEEEVEPAVSEGEGEGKNLGYHSARAKVTICLVLFGLLWGSAVISGIYHVTCSTTLGMWYFARGGDEREAVDTHRAFRGATTRSLGSICLGSLLVALVQVVKMIVDAITRDENGSPNLLYYPLQCLIQIIEFLVEVFNRATLSIVAIYGMRYGLAGCEATKLFESSGLKLLIGADLVGTVGLLTVLVGGVVTGGSGALLGWAGTKYQYFHVADNPHVHVVAGAIAGVILGCQFMMVCSAILDSMIATLLVCFAEEPKQLEMLHPEVHETISEKLALLQPTPAEQEQSAQNV